MDRKKYWDETYYQYWRQRVDETRKNGNKSEIVTGDVKTGGEEIYAHVFTSHRFKQGNILDVGCAWGRCFDLYKRYGLSIYGIDISETMIEKAREQWKNDSAVKQLMECEAENILYKENYFNNVTCLGVFDATFQNKALGEMLRVTKQGGLLYLTGKNSRYQKDDSLAFDAEICARKKGHPNFFTDVSNMKKQLCKKGHEILAGYYFPRRCDFAEFTVTNKMPYEFYLYLLVIKKGAGNYNFKPFSGKFSQTYKRTKGNRK